jgi:RHS repeat-associated protein
VKGTRLIGVVAAVLLLFAIGSGIAFADQNEAGNTNPALFAPPLADPGVEVLADRNATSDTFRLPDGTLQTHIYQAPVNYRAPGGEWKPIEEGLQEQPDGSGLTNGANSFDLSLPERLGAAPVRLSEGDQWVSAQLLSADTKAVQLEGEAATYEAATPETSFALATVPGGIKENIELAGPSAPNVFSFELDASAGLTPSLNAEGAVEFRDEAGVLFATLPAPTMSDSAGTGSEAIHYELESQADGNWKLTVRADAEWLADPQRSWPVSIDPTTVIPKPLLDCSYGGRAGSNERGKCDAVASRKLITAYWPKTTSSLDEWQRALLRFSLSAIPSSTIVTSATFGMHTTEAALNTSGVELRKTTKPWTKDASWTRYDSVSSHLWSTEGGDYSDEVGKILTAERGTQAGWWTFPLSLTPVQEAVSNSQTLDFLAKLLDDKSRECGPTSCTQRQVKFDSSGASAENIPYLSVTYFPAAPAGTKMGLPTEGTVTARRLKLKAEWSEKTSPTAVAFQYREGEKGPFKMIPPGLVKNAKGETAPEWIAVSGVQATEPYYFDTAGIEGLRSKGGTIQVRPLLEGPIGVAGYGQAAKASVNVDAGGTGDATAPVGPGTVNLLTGNFSLSRTDVSIPGITAGLEFTRTINSRQPGVVEDTSVLGRGWKPSAPVELAGGSDWRSVRTFTVTEGEREEGYNDYAILTDLEGSEYAFELVEGAYVAPPEATGYVLSTSNGISMTFRDPEGNVTTFENTSGGSEYLPVSVSMTGGSSNASTMLYDIVNGKRRLKMIIAPSAEHVGCTETSAKTSPGCRSLAFTYQPASTWGAPTAYQDRLASITYYGPTSAESEGSWEVAKYEYDSAGRLIAEWDPRISTCIEGKPPCMKETYAYLGAGSEARTGGQLKTITPPGLKPWTLEYGTVSGQPTDSGRLVAAKRASLLASPSTAQTTIAYEVPVSGSGAPYDMSAKAIEAWGQKDVPVDATAILPPDEPELKGYARASLFYMDSEGRAVNTATPSGAGTEAPSITTAEADEHGNIVRELSAQNRLRALAAGSESVKRAEELETKRRYSKDGTELLEEWGPLHKVRLESGETKTARLHTTIQYEDAKEGWPGIGPDPHLPTRTTTGASIPGQGTDADQRVTETKYNWTLRKPIETITDPGEGHLQLKSRTAYDPSTGLPIESSLPAKPGGGDAHTTKTYYYSNDSVSGLDYCSHKQGLAGLPCVTTPASQPSTEGQPELLVTKYLSYSALSQPTEVIQSPGGKEAPESTRKSLMTYDAAGRLTTSSQIGGGAQLPPTATVYSTTTGLPVEKKLTCETACEGFDSQAVVIAYDELGRPVKYTDADGSTSEMTYDLDGRPAKIYDGKGTQTFGYDPTSGLPTKLEDSAIGTFTAAYNADGAMTEEGLPNGLIAKTTYDEASEPTALSYVKATNCTEKCTWLEEGEESSIYGQVLKRTTLNSSQQYAYDKAGRLTTAKDTQEGACTTRIYAFENEAGKDSNRTSMTTRPPEIGGACATKGGTTQSYTYDAADRLTGEGISYDSFGRITNLPGKYAGGSTLETSFYSNEMVASQSQGGLTNSYQLDATGRVRQVTQSGTKEGTEVFHYSLASDSTAWTERASTWTRDVTGIAGNLAAIQPSSGEASLQLTDLHGDTVATASLNATAKELTAKFEFDEFGNAEKGSAGRYGWLGGKRRRTELPSGVIQMGVRSYVPVLGRFISTDPMQGGSANAYDYANADPVNGLDLGGTCALKKCRHFMKVARKAALRALASSGIRARGGAARAIVEGIFSPNAPLSFRDCVPGEDVGLKATVWNKVMGNNCVPKLHLGPVNSAAETQADAAAGVGWCIAINTFPITSPKTGVLSPLTAAAYCSSGPEDRPWAYVHADGDGVPRNPSTW